LVLSALRQYRALKRSVFTNSKNADPAQREVLEQLEDRLKEVRTKQGEIYEKLWEVESDPDNVVSLVERLNIPELERETEEPSAETGA
jgi:DNA repair ATPase RecN